MMMTETAEAPPDMVVDLFRYQKEWLAWALKQESSKFRGGILADEKGMGKTVQAIALVLATRHLPQSNQPVLCESNYFLEIKATLVIGYNTASVNHWVSEIEKFTKGRAKFLVYPGQELIGTEEFTNYDFVIATSWDTYLDYSNYVTVLDKYNMVEPKMSNSMPSTSKFDLESFTALAKEKSPLFAVKWRRIIFDEVDWILAAQSLKGILALESSFRWALRDIPIQNYFGDLYPLIHFLRVVPYSFWFCMDCDCIGHEYWFSLRCSNCHCKQKNHFKWLNEFITIPIQRMSQSTVGKRATILFKHKILKSLLLRRTKEGRARELEIPPRTVIFRRDALDRREKSHYDTLFSKSLAEFNRDLEAGIVFGHLSHLRQAVDHPYVENYVTPNQTSKTTITGFGSSSIPTSTKIEAVREEIRFMFERDGSAKGIVFSEFDTFLDLINYNLEQSGVKCVQLSRSMSLQAIDVAVKKFQEDPDCRILLMTLETGDIALNLTVASHVFLTEPWWSPELVELAQDHIHRIGQHKPVRIVRFIIEDTIDEKVLKLEEKNNLMFRYGYRGLSVEDILS